MAYTLVYVIFLCTFVLKSRNTYNITFKQPLRSWKIAN